MKKVKFAIIAVTALCAVLTSSTSCCRKQEEKQAKYIFVMIADGMGLNQVAAYESYQNYKNGTTGEHSLRFTQFPHGGVTTTYSASNAITCSAAAGTAIASGHKTNEHYLGVDAEGERVTSMAETLRDEGYKVGIVTSVTINHATPSAFYGHSNNRYGYYELCSDLYNSGFEFFAGNGIRGINGPNKDKEDADIMIARNGYDVYFGLEAFTTREEDGGKVLILPKNSKGQDAPDYDISKELNEDSTADLLQAGIDYLGDEEPFFIMCEGGDIDWGAHANMIFPLFDKISAFNDAVEVAYKFYLEHPDETLIVVTSDHDTGGLVLGHDKGYHIKWNELEEDYSKVNTHTISMEENREICAKHNIAWTHYTHTGSPVGLFAIGVGAEKFAGYMDNTEIYSKVVVK